MIRWRDQPADIGTQPIDALFRSLHLPDALRIAGALGECREGPLLIIEPTVRERVFSHLRSSDAELGGLLIGDAFVHPAGGDSPDQLAVVRVREAIRGDDYASTSVSLQLGTSVWDEARNRLGEGRLVIGWYHSHPRLGAFFSGTDRRTQRAFFAHPYSVGWVIDPYATDQANAERTYLGPHAVELAPTALAFGCADL